MATKMVKLDNRLHITSFNNDMDYNVRFDAEPNNIFIRSTIGNEDMRELVEYLKNNTEHGFNVSEKIQKRVIDWVMEHMPDTTYHITLDFYSEPNYTGNMSRYYLMGLYGERVQFGGTSMKKLYVNRKSAIAAAKRVKEIYPYAHICVFCQNIREGVFENVSTL